MRLSKWGNSLAIRIPAEIAEELELTQNDEALIRVTGKHSFEVVRDRSREDALEGIRKLARPLPAGYKFNRREANDRELARRSEHGTNSGQNAE